MRYNIFNTAHLPLKRSLLAACISVSGCVENKTSSAEALRKVEEVLQVFNEQLTYETLYILPFVFEYEPSVWSNYTSEHNKAARLSKNLSGLVLLYNKQKKKDDKESILKMINESYTGFMLYNFNHMDDEEAVLNEILWRYYSDEVLKQTEEKTDILPHLVNRSKPAQTFTIANAA